LIQRHLSISKAWRRCRKRDRKENKRMKHVNFKDYAEVNERILEGYTITNVSTGINAEDSGMLLELSKKIDNVTIGIDVCFNPAPDPDINETEFMISEEYVKKIE
jgi:hypothetical protein